MTTSSIFLRFFSFTKTSLSKYVPSLALKPSETRPWFQSCNISEKCEEGILLHWKVSTKEGNPFAQRTLLLWPWPVMPSHGSHKFHLEGAWHISITSGTWLVSWLVNQVAESPLITRFDQDMVAIPIFRVCFQGLMLKVGHTGPGKHENGKCVIFQCHISMCVLPDMGLSGNLLFPLQSSLFSCLRLKGSLRCQKDMELLTGQRCSMEL